MNILITAIGILFIVAGLGNWSGHPRVIRMYRDMTLNPNLRFVAGLCELVGGIGLLTPWAKWAALELSVFMAIACIIHIYVKDTLLLTLPSAILMILTGWIFFQL